VTDGQTDRQTDGQTYRILIVKNDRLPTLELSFVTLTKVRVKVRIGVGIADELKRIVFMQAECLPCLLCLS